MIFQSHWRKNKQNLKEPVMKRKNKDNEIPVTAPREILSAIEYAQLPDDEKKLYEPVDRKYEKLPTLTVVLLCIAAIGVIVYVASMISPAFADFFNFTVSHWLRILFASISGIVPFSIAEAIIILMPTLAVVLVIYICKRRCKTWKSTVISLVNILSVLAFILSTFALNFSAGYKGESLDKKLELDKQKVSAEELYESAEYLLNMAASESKYIKFQDDGFSDMPYGISEMNEKLLIAYERFCADFTFMKTFKSRVKPVVLSELMSYTHITGVYTFFTGEANINVAFPDYTIPYTAAHELAHQRGIAREDEANMIAFLVCTYSDDPYIRYSGYMNMYEHVASALRKADRDMYNNSFSHLNSKMLGELRAYSNFFKKYQKSVAATVSNKVNDTYLKSQGTVGSASYGMVVDLTVAYLKDQNLIQ